MKRKDRGDINNNNEIKRIFSKRKNKPIDLEVMISQKPKNNLDSFT